MVNVSAPAEGIIGRLSYSYKIVLTAILSLIPVDYLGGPGKRSVRSTSTRTIMSRMSGKFSSGDSRLGTGNVALPRVTRCDNSRPE